MRKSKDELVNIIFRLEARLSRLETRVDQAETQVLVRADAYVPNLAGLSFDARPHVAEYTRLPAAPVRNTGDTANTTWRLVLVSSDTRHSPLGLEIYDDVIVGRTALGSRIGLDLTAYHAERLGVSRRHALLRPSRYSLFLIDLGSKNGTFCNASRLAPGVAHRLQQDDVVSFSKLHFTVHIVGRPATVEPGA